MLFNEFINPDGAARPSGFTTTNWMLVLSAGTPSSPHADEALETLCRTYWYPLYAFIRRQGHDREAARDLTQEFFARLIQNQLLARADQDKGRFRTFLLAAAKNFLMDQWDRRRALKRGGKCTIVSLDDPTTEARYSLEPSDQLSPDRIDPPARHASPEP